MLSRILLYVGCAVIFAWGIAHLAATKSVVGSFGQSRDENRRIVTMEWIGGGLTLCFIGLVVTLTNAIACSMNPVLPVVTRGAAIFLLFMAVVGSLTGARTSILPLKFCPIIKTVVAILFLLGSIL